MLRERHAWDIEVAKSLRQREHFNALREEICREAKYVSFSIESTSAGANAKSAHGIPFCRDDRSTSGRNAKWHRIQVYTGVFL